MCSFYARRSLSCFPVLTSVLILHVPLIICLNIDYSLPVQVSEFCLLFWYLCYSVVPDSVNRQKDKGVFDYKLQCVIEKNSNGNEVFIIWCKNLVLVCYIILNAFIHFAGYVLFFGFVVL